MLFLVRNDLLVKDRERTYLTASVAVAGTSLTVRAVDSNSWADNDYIIVGEIGSSSAELLQVNGAVSDGTTLTVDQLGSGGCRFAHGAGEPVYRIDYNQVKLYRSTTETGSKTLLATVEIQPDEIESRWDDTTNTTGYGFAAFYNSTTTALSPYSDPIPYEGRSPRSLGAMTERVRDNLLESERDNYIEDTTIHDVLNDVQQTVVDDRMWTFCEVERSMSRVENQFEYDIDSEIKTLHTVRVRTEPIRLVGENEWDRLHWSTDTSSDTQTNASVWNEKLRLYPRPASSASNTNLDGAITASATTITVDNTTGFKRGDYFRFTIDSEIIYATGSTTTTFTGCMRGQEGTTAATHSDNATVTENDIVLKGQKAVVRLDSQNDITVVKNPKILIDGATAELAHTKLKDHSLGDRYDIKFKDGMKKLAEAYGVKITGQHPRVKDWREVPGGRRINPNDYPENIQTV